MTEENIKNILEDYKEETKRHFDVVAEDFISQTKIIAESLSDVQKQLIAIRKMIAKNTEDIEIIKIDIQFIKQELKQKVDRDEFAVLEKRVSLLEAKLNQ